MLTKDTSWNKVADWYKNIVGKGGHYYHQRVIMPNLLRLMALKPQQSVLDLGCGEGVLARYIDKSVNYVGLDLANELIESAKKADSNPRHGYVLADIEKELRIRDKFDWATLILVAQNVRHPYRVIKNACQALKHGGRLLVVINHPCFRIPKHSDWRVEGDKQYRVVDKYMSPLEIPIESSPFDKRNNQTTLSFHYPLSGYSEMLSDNGFLIEKIEEWVSDKKSTGGRAKMENQARKEFPLFLAIVAKKSITN